MDLIVGREDDSFTEIVNQYNELICELEMGVCVNKNTRVETILFLEKLLQRTKRVLQV